MTRAVRHRVAPLGAVATTYFFDQEVEAALNAFE